MLHLMLTRHGLTTAGAGPVLGGQLDVGLTAEGRAQARALANRLAGIRIDRIISSPMQRALETAQVIATGRPVGVDDRLREVDYGRWEGLTSAEIDARDPELRERWERDPAATHPPGGESGGEVAGRALSFLSELLGAEVPPLEAGTPTHRAQDPGGSRPMVSEEAAQASGERRVLIVAHGTFNRILLCVALGIPPREYRRRFVQDFVNLTVLRYERGDAPDCGELVLCNDMAHLRRPGQAPWG
jgi:broad specificity phosphatase PhoE